MWANHVLPVAVCRLFATLPGFEQLSPIDLALIAQRMTGGGFGGCVVALVPRELVEAVRAAVGTDYRGPKGENATIHVCRAAAWAG